MIGKDRLHFTVANLAESDKIGSYILGSGDAVIESKSIGGSDWLQAAVALFDKDGDGIDSTTNALWVHLKASDVALNVELDHTDGDSVQIGDGTDIMLVNADGSINAVVTATNLDIRDLTHVTDSVKIGDGTDFLAIDASGNIGVTDAGGSLTVDAVDLDIRDLAAATDSVSAWTKDGSGNSISSTTGSLHVNVTNATLTVSDAALANTSMQAEAASVTSTSAALIASVLSGRKYAFIQNLGNRSIYLGPSGVSVATGLRLSPGSVAEFRIGSAVAFHAVTDSGTQDTRILQAA